MDEGHVSFGELGARAREMRLAKGISLSEVSLHTRVREHILSAIEEGRLEDLPAAVYVRGFVKSYLSFLDAEDLWPAFERAIPLAGATNVTHALGTYSTATKGFRRVTRRGAYILLVLLVIVAVAFAWSQWDTIRRSVAERTTPSAVVVPAQIPEATSEPLPEAVDGTGTTSPNISPVEVARVLSEMFPSPDLSPDALQVFLPLSDEVPPVSEGPVGVESVDFPWLHEMAPTTPQPQQEEPMDLLRVETAGACWVQVRQGERILYTGTMQKGDSKEFSVSAETSVRLGNPAVVTITWQGKSLPASDGTGKPRTIRFTPQGEMR
ncbi:RodZ domain-containing protein [Aminiphilus sp.]|uniref:helix-turn-helix domain-containing protein n=1 Tax=Aminiphilus sp. TaxID=1872488 RepID=UPI0026110058|nr:RodZ domain-containing protein [Aminiphilus sp.]